MTSKFKRVLLLVLVGSLAASLMHRLGQAQSVAPVSIPASAANPANDAWGPSATELMAALGDQDVVPAYQVKDLDWTDASRQRAVPVRLYLPHQAKASHPVPLVVFSHGLGGSRMGYSYLGRYLAQNGVASLHLQHVGSDRAIWTGNLLGLNQRLKDATTEAEAIARTQDFRFALSTVLAHPELGPLLNAQQVLAAGHSFGANTSLLLAGAKVAPIAQAITLQDPRIKGVVLLSSPPFYGAGNTEDALAHMTIPSLHITATDDIIRVPGYYSSAEERIAVYTAYQGAPKSLVVFKDGSHSVFTDRLKTGGVEQNPRIKRATREVVLAFVQQVVGAAPPATNVDWAQRNASLLARVENLPGGTSLGSQVARH